MPGWCAWIGDPFAWSMCLQFQEKCGWEDPHASLSQKLFVESGGGGALGGEQLRAVLPTELHTLEGALTISGWGERPNPEWTSTVLGSWIAAPRWGNLAPCSLLLSTEVNLSSC